MLIQIILPDGLEKDPCQLQQKKRNKLNFSPLEKQYGSDSLRKRIDTTDNPPTLTAKQTNQR